MEQQAANPLVSLFPLILIFVVFYFLLIMPQQKQRKKHEEMVKNLAKFDDVVTNGGVHGTIVNIKDTTVIMKVDDNAKIEIDKYSIAYIKKKKSGEETGK